MAKKYPDKIREEIKLELLNDNCSLKDIAEKALRIASKICVFTNDNIKVEEI